MWHVLQKSFHALLEASLIRIPLTIHKPSKADLMPLIDKVSSKFLGCKTPLLSKAGRQVVVKSVLSATPIHLMIALDLPKWVIKVVDKGDEVSFGKAKSKPMVVTAWFPGQRCSGHTCVVVLVFMTWKDWVGLAHALALVHEGRRLETLGWASGSDP
ncbi:LOW QUALITY PROTEIN: hypothetical protein U9M48_013881 [Paspalum notatum var. saurae]|uniref:Uncharacterized protein n=1 Tax=Paspalum notatum var. saurae TaxID=547442 RepID=A0AAQ3WJZ1_PASNO